MKVTREFLSAWLLADRIAIHHTETGKLNTTEAERGAIRMIRENAQTGREEMETAFTLPSTMGYQYSEDRTREYHYGFALLYNWQSQSYSVTRGIAYALRVGDEIALDWHPDGSRNQYMKDASLHGDILRLAVKRGSKTFALELDRQTCADNSARMCRSELYGGY